MVQLIARYYETPVSKAIPVPVELGTTIDQLIDGMKLPEHVRDRVVVLKDGEYLDGDYVIIEDGEITIGVVQGKGAIAAVLTIALAVFAQPLALALMPGLTGTSLALATAAITMVGSLVIGALIPPPSTPGQGVQEKADDVYFITGASNGARFYEPVPSIYGKHKVFPDLAATPRVESVGTTSEIAMVLDLGPGDVVVTDARIGDTPATQLGFSVTPFTNTKTPDFKYVNDLAASQSFKMVGGPTWQTLTSAAGSTKVELVMQFPRGLWVQNNDGSSAITSISVSVQYRKVGATTWQTANTALAGVEFPPPFIANIPKTPANRTGDGSNWGDDVKRYNAIAEANRKNQGRSGISYSNGVFNGKLLEPFVAVFPISGLDADQYEVRFKGDAPSANLRVNNNWEIVQLKSYKSGKPVTPSVPHTFLEVYGIASEKLSGQIQTLNVMASRKVRDITATGFAGLIETSNPALIALDILTGAENPDPLVDGQIDFASWKALKDFSGTKFTYNGVIRSEATIKEHVNNVLGNARAQLNMSANGKVGVLIDQAGRVPRQMITPANSWDFSGTRNFPYYPDALRVSYIEPNAQYQRAEVIVYADGKNESNADTYEDLTTRGVTDHAEAWRYGRFMMAQAKMRNETFTVSMDIEHLAVTRGDVIAVQHDVPKFGGLAARVVSVAGKVVKIDQDFAATGTLGARIRLADGSIVTRGITASTIDTVTLDSAVAGLDYGDLIVIGQLGQETQDYIILAIEPDTNMAATLTLVPYVPEVYTADTGTVPPWDPGFGIDLTGGTDLKVETVAALYSIGYTDRRPQGKVELTWSVSGGITGLAYYNVERIMPDGSREVIATTKVPFYQQTIDLLTNPDLHNQDIQYVITPINLLGVGGVSGQTTQKILPDITPPAPVDGYAVNVVNNSQIDIFWRGNTEPDIAYYELRYSPLMDGALWNSAVKLARVDYTTNRTAVGARTGTYFIVAVDTSGNKSTPRALHTAVEKLPGLDLIVNVDEAGAGWPGTLQNMVNGTNGLSLSGSFGNVTPRGYYMFSQIFDAGDIQELRLQAKMKVYGVAKDDVMSLWVPLSSVPALARADTDQFDAWMEVRTADKMAVMADWVPLSGTEADPIGKGSVQWAPWRRFESSDVTGRLFQFRLVAETENPNFNVVVQSARVEIDVMERYESFPDVVITDANAGVQVDFVPPFRSIPALAVTIDGSTDNLRYEVISKSNTSAQIKLFHGAGHGTAETGKIDVNALGWGRIRTQPL